MNGSDDKFVDFVGLRFGGLRFRDLLPESGRTKFVVTVNADLVVISRSSRRFRQLVARSLSTFDGQVTYWLARMLARPRGVEFEKISGSTLAVELLHFAETAGLRVFILGAAPASNQALVTKLGARGVAVEGFSPPVASYPFPDAWSSDVQRRISGFGPQILLVGLGSPKQEFWLDDNREFLQALGLQVGVGCGGAIDMLAGKFPRAPSWIQNLGLEGLFRLAVQPRWFRLKRLGRSLLIFPIAFSRRSAYRD